MRGGCSAYQCRDRTGGWGLGGSLSMTLDEFNATLTVATPPVVPPLLLALWYDARGDWEKAHTLAQEVDDASGAWVHAYLHRKEGDLDNAGYWYRRANRLVATDSLGAEWARIAMALLE
jgi:hypothetical protein